jgi:pyridoxal phosphate enzyme (YggS family)
VSTLAERLAAIRERVALAVDRRGGDPVLLIGVSKRQPIEKLHEAVAENLFDFGENYAQELRDKRRDFPDPRARWHFIGPVQTNKVKYVIGTTCIHTVDRTELLEAIEKKAAQRDIVQSVLVQVNIAGEEQKHGAAPDEVPALLDRFADCDHVRCDGLMLIPPQGTPEQTAAHFRDLRRLRDDLAATARPGVTLRELSMGMSADFESAIAEGATMIRVGTAIFGPRPA